MATWEAIPLASVTSKIGSGATPRGGKEAYKDTGISLIRSLNVYDMEFSRENLAFIDEQQADGLSNVIVEENDVLLNITGASVARCCLVPADVLPARVNQHVAIIRADSQKADGRFIAYALVSPYYKSYLLSVAQGGATREALTKGTLEQFEVRIPPLNVQRAIADTLSAFDNLLENNARRIKLLEQMAQLIYREWFIDFRFPGHKDVEMVESELGLIPEGWEVQPVEKLLEQHIGGGWGKEVCEEKHEIPAYVIRGTDIPSARYGSRDNVPLRYHTQSNLAARRLEPGNIVFEVSGGSKDQPTGRALLISSTLLNAFGQDVICASFCKRLQVKNAHICPEYLYWHFTRLYDSREIEKYEVQSTGIKNFKFSHFLSEEKLPVAPPRLQQKFLQAVSPPMQLIQLLGAKNSNLRQTRDMLLPKLISGELDVSEMREIPYTREEVS